MSNNIDPRDTQALEDAQREQAKLRKQDKTAEDSLYSVVFSTEAGQKLLDLWQERHVHTWIAEPHSTQIAIGVKQGQANFVMDIINRLKQIEKGDING